MGRLCYKEKKQGRRNCLEGAVLPSWLDLGLEDIKMQTPQEQLKMEKGQAQTPTAYLQLRMLGPLGQLVKA